MLKDRRNCFFGLGPGFDPFRAWPAIGDPLRELPPHKPKRGRGATKAGEAARTGAGFSCTGDSAKISDRANEEEFAGLLQQESINLNCGA